MARRVGNAREVRSGCRAEPCPSARRRLAAVFALLSCSCLAQAVGLDHPPGGQVGPGEPSAPRQCGACSASGPSHHGCLQFLGLDGPVSVTAAG
jgi:hypothetical protein